MGLIVLVVVVALVLGRLAATPAAWRRPRLTGIALLLTGLAVQLAEPALAGRIAHSYPVCLAISATLLVQFAARNLRVPGVGLAVAGIVANAAVVLANGAMPVSESAATRAGLAAAVDPAHHRQQPLDDDTRLPWLAERLPVPIPGHRDVASVGDIAVAAGAGLFAFAAVRRRDPAATSGIMTEWTADRC